MRHLGADVKVDAAIRALNRLDNWMREHYERIQTWAHPEEYVPSATDACTFMAAASSSRTASSPRRTRRQWTSSWPSHESIG
jgi:uncharacterized heparinase superfamily protein